MVGIILYNTIKKYYIKQSTLVIFIFYISWEIYHAMHGMVKILQYRKLSLFIIWKIIKKKRLYS